MNIDYHGEILILIGEQYQKYLRKCVQVLSFLVWDQSINESC